MFPLTEAAVTEIDDLPVLKESICNHLHILQQRLSHYFPDLNVSHNDWVRNPFNQSAIKAANIVDLLAQEQLLELSIDHSLQLKHNEMDLAISGLAFSRSIPNFFNKPFTFFAICHNIPLWIGFFFSDFDKNKQRSGLEGVEHKLRVCLSDIQPHTKTICARMQSHPSQEIMLLLCIKC